MIHIQAPQDYAEYLTSARPAVFLGGSIEMGAAERWQDALADDLQNEDVLLLNPRRTDWDASWKQSMDQPQFRGQVEWELQALEDADLILLYLQPGTKSPISLLELGLYAKSAPEKLLVCCPDGFWRKGNVDIVCARYGVQQVADKAALTETLRIFVKTGQLEAA
ncbi:MAG: hypothetical protein EA357_08060 [Micavibrio sp.]|nr:MAG: hypothetical protein EA357_08060 [Micavibrio sp.]